MESLTSKSMQDKYSVLEDRIRSHKNVIYWNNGCKTRKLNSSKCKVLLRGLKKSVMQLQGGDWVAVKTGSSYEKHLDFE